MPRGPLVLGLNAGHADASACLVAGGEVLMALEEERLRRTKYYFGLPVHAAATCLRACGASAGDLRAIAVNRDARAALPAKLRHVLRWPKSLLLHRRVQAPSSGGDVVPLWEGRGLTPVEHHEAHLWSAWWGSPFDEAAVVSVDGSGDFSTLRWGRARGRKVEVMGGTPFPHSLGLLYLALTQFLGFPAYGDEYKVMGLAAYGEPRFAPEMRRLVHLRPAGGFRLDLRFFRHHVEPLLQVGREGQPHFGAHYSPSLELLLGSARRKDEAIEDRHEDLAASIQVVYEEVLLHVLRHVRRVTGCRDLCLAGGCAHNSLANGSVLREAGFDDVWIPSAPGDAGGALGAAWAVSTRLGGERTPLIRADLGPAYDRTHLRVALRTRKEELRGAGIRILHPTPAELVAKTARLIASGKLVGWFQGRAEWGPRALGQRSILADPRRRESRDALNRKVKRREDFRPLAPSVLHERAAEWFDLPFDLPFMSAVVDVREAKRSFIPAVTHADGTARPQMVREDVHPTYHALITEFERLTGVPMVINTSFNVQEPIVCSPEDALRTFEATKLDALVLAEHLLVREDALTLKGGQRHAGSGVKASH